MFLITYRTSIEPWCVVSYYFIALIISLAQPPRETACTHALNHISRQNKLQNHSATCKSTEHTSRFFFSRIRRTRIRYVFSFVTMLTFQWGIRNNWHLRAKRSGTLTISPAETIENQFTRKSVWVAYTFLAWREPVICPWIYGIFRITTNRPSPSVKLNMKLVAAIRN